MKWVIDIVRIFQASQWEGSQNTVFLNSELRPKKPLERGAIFPPPSRGTTPDDVHLLNCNQLRWEDLYIQRWRNALLHNAWSLQPHSTQQALPPPPFLTKWGGSDANFVKYYLPLLVCLILAWKYFLKVIYNHIVKSKGSIPHLFCSMFHLLSPSGAERQRSKAQGTWGNLK